MISVIFLCLISSVVHAIICLICETVDSFVVIFVRLACASSDCTCVGIFPATAISTGLS